MIVFSVKGATSMANNDNDKVPTTIDVVAKDDEMRAALKHPSGARFSKHPNGTPWPLDQFTYRRLQDGDVLAAPPKAIT
jgi:hypothetical protein